MHRSVLLELEALRRANVASLREKYRQVFGEETRCRQGAVKLRNGAAVQVNNSVQPSNNATPRVEDR